METPQGQESNEGETNEPWSSTAMTKPQEEEDESAPVSSALPDEGGMEKGVDEHVKIQDK
jgi:hypothetical protein